MFVFVFSGFLVLIVEACSQVLLFIFEFFVCFSCSVFQHVVMGFLRILRFPSLFSIYVVSVNRGNKHEHNASSVVITG